MRDMPLVNFEMTKFENAMPLFESEVAAWLTPSVVKFEKDRR